MHSVPVQHHMVAFPLFIIAVVGFAAAVAIALSALWRRPSPLVGALLVGGLAIAALLAGSLGFVTVRQAPQARHVAPQQHFAFDPPLREFRSAERASLIPLPDLGSPVEAPHPAADAVWKERREAAASTVVKTPLPEWVSSQVATSGDNQLVVVHGEQFADPNVSWREALADATALVRRNFEEFTLHTDAWVLEPEVVRASAVRKSFTERIDRSAGEHEFTVYRTYLLVELSPQVREQIEPVWRTQVATARSYAVGGLLMFCMAAAGVFAGYFRLDDRTHGRYRWRLRLGVLAAVPLIGLTLLTAARLAASEATSRSVEKVSSPVVDLRTREEFQAVADHMVQAINAADYEGLRRDFNGNMLDKFPVETCRTFFDDSISGKYGKITALESPVFKSSSVAVMVARCEKGTLDFTLALDEHGQVAGMLFRRRLGVPIPACDQVTLAPGLVP